MVYFNQLLFLRTNILIFLLPLKNIVGATYSAFFKVFQILILVQHQPLYGYLLQLYKCEGEVWGLSLHQANVNLVFWLLIGSFGTKS